MNQTAIKPTLPKFQTSFLCALFTLVFYLLSPSEAKAQWMLINQNGGSPDSSAALELSDTTRGFLPTRLSTAQMDSIANPAAGLLIYNTDDSAFKYYDGLSWQSIGSGSIPAADSATVPVGSILPYAGATEPQGFLICDGSLVPTATYPELFAAIGYAWGGSAANFNLPDLRGRFMRGVDRSSGNDPDAAGRTAINTGGNTGDNVGSLQADELGSHNHTLNYRSASAPTAGVGLLSGLGINNHTGAANQSASGISTEGGNETRPINANVNFIICYNSALAAADSSTLAGVLNGQDLATVLGNGNDASGDSIVGLGALGIGTNSPLAPLEINANTPYIRMKDNNSSGSSSTSIIAMVDQSNATLGTFEYQAGSIRFINQVTNSRMSFYTKGFNGVGTGTFENLTITGDYGLVGINRNAPTRKLHVFGTIMSEDTVSNEKITINGLGGIETVTGQSLHLNQNSSDSVILAAGGGPVVINDAWILPSATGSNGQVLQTDGAGAASWQSPASSPWALNVDTVSILNKLVGIGTSNPTDFFHVINSGNTRFAFESSSGDATLDIRSFTGFDSRIRFREDGANKFQFGYDESLNGLLWSGPNWGSFQWMLLDTLGKLGIGVTSPQNALHIEEYLSQSTYLQVTNSLSGSTATDGLLVGQFGSLARILNQENGIMAFGTNNTYHMNLDATGNLGLGTTTPDSTLTVVGGIEAENIRLSNGAANGRVLTSDANGSASWQSPSIGSVLADADADTRIELEENADDDTLRLYTAGTQWLSMSPEGNLGLRKFDSGVDLFVQDTTAAIYVESTNDPSWANMNLVTPNSHYSLISGLGTTRGFGIKDITRNVTDFSIDSTGNVGIGTVNQSHQLEVAGDTAATIVLKNKTNNASSYPGIAWQNTGANYAWSLHRSAQQYADLLLRGGLASSTGNLDTVMYYRNNGNVGVGLLPNYKLHVDGATGVSDELYVQNGLAIGHTNPEGQLHIEGDSLAAIIIQTTDNTKEQGILFRNNAAKYTWSIFREDEGSNDANLNFRGGPNTNDPLALPYRLRMMSSGQVIFNDSIGYGEFSITSKNNDSTVFAIKGTNDTALFRLRQSSSGSAQLYMHKSNGDVGVDLRAGTGDSYISEGQFGIGTDNPESKLHIHDGHLTMYNDPTSADYIVARNNVDSARVFYVYSGINDNGNLSLYGAGGEHKIRMTTGGSSTYFLNDVFEWSFGAKSMNNNTDFQVVDSVDNLVFDLETNGPGNFDTRFRFRDSSSNKYQLGYDKGLDEFVISGSNWTGSRLLRVNSTGEVGIGEAPTTTEMLNVAGDIEVDGDYTYESAKTKYLSLPSIAFDYAGTNSTQQTVLDNIPGYATIASGAGNAASLSAPVYLPDGATITNVDFYVLDQDNTEEVQGFMGYHTHATTTLTNMATTTASGVAASSGAVVTLSDNTITNPVIDNQNRAYFIRLQTVEGATNLRLYSARITYTVTQAE